MGVSGSPEFSYRKKKRVAAAGPVPAVAVVRQRGREEREGTARRAEREKQIVATIPPEIDVSIA